MKKNKKITRPKENKNIKGVQRDLTYLALALYVISSLISYFWPSPVVPAFFWLIGLLIYQFSGDAFLRFHALQGAAINLIFVILRFVEMIISKFVSSPEVTESWSMRGIVSTVIVFSIMILQIIGAESSLRGRMLKIPLVYKLAEKLMQVFFGQNEVLEEEES